MFSGIFSRKTSEYESSQEKKKIAISLVTGKDQSPSRYSASPQKMMMKLLPKPTKVYLHPLLSDESSVKGGDLGLQSFNPQLYETLTRARSHDKQVQTSVQNEESSPPKPESSVPLMHNGEENLRHKKSTPNKKSILRKSKCPLSNSASSLFQ